MTLSDPSASQESLSTIEHLPLTGDCGLRGAVALAGRLGEALAGPGGVQVDAAGLTGGDASLVQLLVAAWRSAEAAGKPFLVSAPAGGVLQDVLAGLGLVDPEGASRLPFPLVWQNAA